MLLPFTDALIVTSKFDAECAMLADRHYSRQKAGSRTYPISHEDLEVLHSLMEECLMERDCHKCKDDLCERCQKLADLRQTLADALSLSSAGVEITLTTAEGEPEATKQHERVRIQ